MATTSIVMLHPLQDRLPDGTEIRRVPDMTRTGNRPLYVSFDGRPFSHVLVKDHETGLHVWIYRQVAPCLDTRPCNRFNGNRKQRYYKMRYHGNIYLAHAVLLAWIGEQQTDEEGLPYQCHHLNGITFDNRASNLIWLSRANHKIYDARQKALREQLGNLQIFNRSDFDRWHAMSDDGFHDMLAKLEHEDPNDRIKYEMTHHMEV